MQKLGNNISKRNVDLTLNRSVIEANRKPLYNGAYKNMQQENKSQDLLNYDGGWEVEDNPHSRSVILPPV